MRLIRTVLQPVNIGLSRQFQQSQVIKTSSSDLLHTVLIGISNLEYGSNIRLYSASACASSETSLNTKKACGRVPKDVRKSMVENFVNRYRKTNAGKFPTVSEAKKDVGGSYYVIREILQELIYNSKMSPTVDTKTASSEKSAIKKDEIWTTNTEKDSQATEMEELIIISPISKVAVRYSSSEIFESNQHPQPSILVASDDESKEVGKQSYHPTDEPRSKQHLDPENDMTAHEDEQKSNDKIAHEDGQKCNDKAAHEDGQKLDGLDSTEVSGRELQKVTTEDADDKTKTSMWQNLKSLANEILEMWKRN